MYYLTWTFAAYCLAMLVIDLLHLYSQIVYAIFWGIWPSCEEDWNLTCFKHDFVIARQPD